MLLNDLFEADYEDVLKGLELPSYAGPGKLPKKGIHKPLAPGERRKMKIRLDDLRHRFDQVRQYHETIKRFMQVMPPGMEEDLVALEKEYLEAIRAETDALNASVGQTKLIKLLNGLSVKCSDAIASMKAADTFLFRGAERDGDAYISKPFDKRRTMTSVAEVQQFYDKKIAEVGFKALRGNSIFTSGDRTLSSGFGSIQYMIFPVNGFSFTYSTNPEKRDIVIGTDSLNEWVDKSIVEWLWDVIFTDPTRRAEFARRRDWSVDSLGDRGYPESYSKYNIMGWNGFMDHSNYHTDFSIIRAMKGDGLFGGVDGEIPEDREDLISGDSIVKSMSLSNTDFAGALRSGNEICVRGRYYAINCDHIDAAQEYFKIKLSRTEQPETSSEDDPYEAAADLYNDPEDEDEDYDENNYKD